MAAAAITCPIQIGAVTSTTCRANMPAIADLFDMFKLVSVSPICDLLKLRVEINSYNDHVRLISPEPVGRPSTTSFTREWEPALSRNQLDSSDTRKRDLCLETRPEPAPNWRGRCEPAQRTQRQMLHERVSYYGA